MNFILDTIESKAADRAIAMPVFGDAKSLATLALCVKALSKERVYCVHIDHGMLRKNEAKKVKEYIENLGIANSVFVKCENAFLMSSVKKAEERIIGPLSMVCIPAEKREIILSAMNRIYADAVASFGVPDLLVTGMHTVGGESIADVGDNAADIAKAAGADVSLLRQPFPMQAYAIRMLCHKSVIALTTEQRELVYNIANEISDAVSARLVPLRTVGIHEGVRTYKSMALISDKGEQSDFDKLFEIAVELNNKATFVNRVVCRVDSDSHAFPYHSHPSHLCKEGFDILRVADEIVAEEFDKTPAAQFFAVLLPIVEDTEKHYSVVIRAVSTADFKTARALVPGKDFSKEVLASAAKRIKETLRDTVDMVLYDITSKPPAAIEWE
ncbi:MAG: hypothetical protein E7598_00670 [Ruminococcaceae bacterium]|nr:hypothetical protein [Oscillospiraceae bacterium]